MDTSTERRGEAQYIAVRDMDKAVDAEITEVSTNDNVEDVVKSPEDESRYRRGH